jgi:hypothetical protein
VPLPRGDNRRVVLRRLYVSEPLVLKPDHAQARLRRLAAAMSWLRHGACPAAMGSVHAADSVCSLATRPGPAAARLIFAQIGQARFALGRAWRGSEPLAHNGVVGGLSPPPSLRSTAAPRLATRRAPCNCPHSRIAAAGPCFLQMWIMLAENCCGMSLRLPSRQFFESRPRRSMELTHRGAPPLQTT